MINLAKFTVILISIIFCSLLAGHLNITQTDIAKFFPQTQQESFIKELKLKQRYLFVSSRNPDLNLDIEETGLVKQVIDIPATDSGQYKALLIYSLEKQSKLLQFLKGNQILGPPIIGELLSDELIEELWGYLLLFIPLVILAIYFLTNARFLINALLETSLFSVLLLGIILFYSIELNSASLLALLFVYIYIFTLINQLYFNKLNPNLLRISFIVSVATTWLSGLLLSLSDFGLVSDFGYALTIWVTVLALYLAIRLQFIDQTRLSLPWFSFEPAIYKTPVIWLGVFLFSIGCAALYLVKPVSVELNPLSLSAKQKEIAKFETNVAQAQPFLVQVYSNECSLRDVECAIKYQRFISDLQDKVEVDYQVLFNLETAYRQFSEESFNEINSGKFAQFKLANDMAGTDQLLFGANGRSLIYIGSLSLLEPVSTLVKLKSALDKVSQSQQAFTLRVLGHTSMAKQYQSRFIEETAYSLFNILLLLSVMFAILFKKVKALVTLLPIMLSLMGFMLLHMLFNIEVSVISLIAVILFVGIVSDNLIHIILTYRGFQSDCFRTVFKPVVLSSLIMIVSLAVMAIFMEGVLHFFGLELAILLTSHLMLSMLLLPTLYRHYLPK